MTTNTFVCTATQKRVGGCQSFQWVSPAFLFNVAKAVLRNWFAKILKSAIYKREQLVCEYEILNPVDFSKLSFKNIERPWPPNIKNNQNFCAWIITSSPLDLLLELQSIFSISLSWYRTLRVKRSKMSFSQNRSQILQHHRQKWERED